MSNKTLTEKQQAYYNNRVAFFKSMGIAAPTGIIQEKAESLSDEECDRLLREHLDN
jgi:hypothetical protein